MNTREYVYIYGAGNRGEELCRLIEERYSASIGIEAFIDKYKEGQIGPYKVKLCSEDIPKDRKVIISIWNFEIALSAAMELKEKGFQEIYWFNVKNKRYKQKDFFVEQCVSCKGWNEATLPHVEIHAMDACNLNCVACTHFAPIFKREKPDTKERFLDIALLRKKIASIVNFFIMGGEPLLNDELEKYVIEVRKQYPEASIIIVTNGLLLPQCSDKLLELLNRNNVCVSISEYAPTHRIINQIINRLNDHNVIYNIRPFNQKEKFNLPLSRIKTEEKYCISQECINIWNKKIARCPTLMYIAELNQKFDLDFPTDGIIDLQSDISGVELKQRLQETIPLCDYCSKNEIEWSVCNKTVTVSDFVKM